MSIDIYDMYPVLRSAVAKSPHRLHLYVGTREIARRLLHLVPVPVGQHFQIAQMFQALGSEVGALGNV